MANGINKENCYMDALRFVAESNEFSKISVETAAKIAEIAVEYAEHGYERGREEAIEEMQRSKSAQEIAKQISDEIKRLINTPYKPY